MWYLTLSKQGNGPLGWFVTFVSLNDVRELVRTGVIPKTDLYSNYGDCMDEAVRRAKVKLSNGVYAASRSVNRNVRMLWKPEGW